MKHLMKLVTTMLGAIVVLIPIASARARSAATDPPIDPQVRAFLADLNKDNSPFWELPQPKPQEILTALQRSQKEEDNEYSNCEE